MKEEYLKAAKLVDEHGADAAYVMSSAAYIAMDKTLIGRKNLWSDQDPDVVRLALCLMAAIGTEFASEAAIK